MPDITTLLLVPVLVYAAFVSFNEYRSWLDLERFLQEGQE